MTSNVRQIELVLCSTPTIEGAEVHLRRAFGFHEVRRFDPFLLLDDFCSSPASPSVTLGMSFAALL